MPRLSPTEAAASGFTDELVIRYEDFLESNAGTLANDETYTISYNFPVIAIVEKVAIYARAPIAGAGNVTMTAGDDDDADGFLTSKNVFAIAVGYNDGAYFAGEDSSEGETDDISISNALNGKLYASADDSIDFVFTPGSGATLNDATAGEILIRMKISRFGL